MQQGIQPKFTIGTVIRPDDNFRFYKIKDIQPSTPFSIHAYTYYHCVKCTSRGKEYYSRKSFKVQDIDAKCIAICVEPNEILVETSKAGILKMRRTCLMKKVNRLKLEISQIEEELVHLNQNEVSRDNIQHISPNISDEARQTFQI